MVKYLCCKREWCCSFCRYCLCSRLPFYECSNSGHRIYREGSLAFLHGPMSVSFSDVVYNYSGYNDYDDDYYFIFCYYEGKPTLDLQVLKQLVAKSNINKHSTSLKCGETGSFVHTISNITYESNMYYNLQGHDSNLQYIINQMRIRIILLYCRENSKPRKNQGRKS